MATQRRSRVPVLVLALALVALPAVARERPAGQTEKGFLEVLVRAFAELVPAAAKLADGLLPESGALAAPPDDPQSGTEGDLGPGLDPLG